MENTDRVLRESAYNDAVDGYRALLSSLPLRLLRPVIFVETPAYFRAS